MIPRSDRSGPCGLPHLKPESDAPFSLLKGYHFGSKRFSSATIPAESASDEISYSQPVLYAHFGSREGILAAVAIEGFREIGLALEKARKRARRGNPVESVAYAYLQFAASSPALYEVMFSLGLSLPFDDAATPPELHFAFSQLMELFQGQNANPGVISELFWASLHGIAELTRTKRFPRSRQRERVRALVELFTFSWDETAPVV